jgi:hypothetical protein
MQNPNKNRNKKKKTKFNGTVETKCMQILELSIMWQLQAYMEQAPS